MLEHLALQSDALAGAAVLAVLAGIIALAAFAVARRRSASKRRQEQESRLDLIIKHDISRIDGELKSARERLDALSTSAAQAGQVEDIKRDLGRVCSDFERLSGDIDEKLENMKRATAEEVGTAKISMEKMQRTATEEMDSARLSMEKMALEKVARDVSEAIKTSGVPRSEFEVLRERFDRMHGADEAEERMVVLSRLFDSDKIRVLNWQCRLVRLLRGGLAPAAEQDLMVSEDIPDSSFKKFLKNLVDEGVAKSKSIPAYYLEDEYEWIYEYVEKPDWLRRRLLGTVKREADYQRYVRARVGTIEDGLILEDTEYALDTGRLDLICRASDGRTVGIELKYPAAEVRDKRQVAGYRDDYRRKSGAPDPRFMLVAPRIPDELKKLLVEDGIEYREVPYEPDGPAA